MNIGILSTAKIATRSVIPTLLALSEQFKVIGIASRSIEKATQVSDAFGCKAYESYDSLLAEDDINAVYIPLPTGLHFEWVTKSLNAGKHVLCEKSLACTFSETQQMVDLAKSMGLALVENFQFRFHSQLETLQKIIRDGMIGEVRTIRSSFGFPPFPEKDNIRYNKELGGGALLDAGAYMMKVGSILLGKNAKVSSAVWHVDPKLGVDLHGSGLLINSNTRISAHIAFGFDHFYQCGVEVWGSLGRLRTNRLFTARADHCPEIDIEIASGCKKIELDTDDHFRKMLQYFHKVCDNDSGALRDLEYNQNLIQAQLIQQFRDLANG